MTSTRLPGKVLADVAGRPMLERQLERLARCATPTRSSLAITTNADDDPLAELAQRLGYGVHRGSEHDVLSRYAGAAAAFRADVVVRVTSDCPLIDPEQTDAVIEALTSEVDYAANVLERRLPRGLDTEALWRDVLDRCDRMATSTPAREHVTWHIHTEHPERFVLRSVRGRSRRRRPALDGRHARGSRARAPHLRDARRRGGPRRSSRGCASTRMSPPSTPTSSRSPTSIRRRGHSLRAPVDQRGRRAGRAGGAPVRAPDAGPRDHPLRAGVRRRRGRAVRGRVLLRHRGAARRRLRRRPRARATSC